MSEFDIRLIYYKRVDNTGEKKMSFWNFVFDTLLMGSLVEQVVEIDDEYYDEYYNDYLEE